MIVLSLVLVVAAAVSLLIGLFATESLALIFVAIGLCVGSLALLFVGSRQRRTSPEAASSPPSRPAYGGPPSTGVSRPTTPSTSGGDEPSVVKKTTAKDAASARVASAGPVARVADAASGDDAEETVVVTASTQSDAVAGDVTEDVAPEKVAASVADDTAAPAKKPAKKVVKKAAAKKSATKKTSSTKKAAAKKTAAKSTKKSAAKKKASSAKKSSTKKSTVKKTTGAAAKAVLDGVSGVGPAKQDALLKKFKSIEAIKAASEDDIAKVSGFGPALAKRVKSELP